MVMLFGFGFLFLLPIVGVLIYLGWKRTRGE
jgi:hypothetical protein